MAEPNTPPTEAAPAPPARKTSLMARLGILLSVLTVIAIECAVAYVFLPNSAQTEAMAAAAIAESDPAPSAHSDQKKSEPKKSEHKKSEPKKSEQGKSEEKKPGKPDGEEHESGDLVEVDLGEFTVTASQPSNNSTLRIAFHLFGAVPSIDHADFESKMKEIQHRYREQVLVTLRGASVNDLTDAGLGLLKRTILEKTNALLGKPLLKMVIFSEFSFYEM